MEKDLVSQLSNILTQVATDLGCKFIMRSEPIATSRVFDSKGLLPAIMRRADQLADFCLGYGLGAQYNKSESAELGLELELGDGAPNSLRILCCMDVLYELIQSSASKASISVDELIN